MAVLVALLLMMALTAPAAFAQSSQDGYIQEGPSVIDRTAGDPGDPGDPAAEIANADGNGNELPFTGLDLGLVAVAGASLMLLGVGMRRLTKASDPV